MLQVDNRTPFNAALAVFADPAGVETAYLAVKAAFDLTAQGVVPCARPVPFLPADVYWGDPARTGLRAAGDLTLAKPATDIMMLGHAMARDPQRTVVMDVSLSVGPVAHTLRVFGPRQWDRQGGSWRMTPPGPFEKVPLRWELAFGGVAAAHGDQPPNEFEPRNPVGCGFAGRHESDFTGRPLPQIEHPAQMIAQPQDRPTPVGCAPIPPAWSPRREYAGTYDEAWTRSRAPYLPLDFDPRFLQSSPPPLVAPGYLRGGERVELSGVWSGGGSATFALPTCTFDLEFDFKGRSTPAVPNLDTVILEPDLFRLQLVYRAALAVDKDALKLKEVRVRCREYAKPVAER